MNTLVKLAAEKKGYDMIALDVSRLCSYTEVIIVCHGTSSRQAQAIADHIRRNMKKELDADPLGVEGETEGQWIVMDYNDVVFHVFYEPTREFYDLEGIWSDAPTGRLFQDKKDVYIDWPDGEAGDRGPAGEDRAAGPSPGKA